ncbi:hypothetical protein [Deinococcus sp. KNUC1210]|uniref:hypothetical protein n=1 Tax=Deinococcus sp. KNUC1210 TaxID=2917691 RepID=UPI00351D5904
MRLSKHLTQRGFALLDAQIQNPHLARFGTYEVSGKVYRTLLKEALERQVSLIP